MKKFKIIMAVLVIALTSFLSACFGTSFTLDQGVYKIESVVEVSTNQTVSIFPQNYLEITIGKNGIEIEQEGQSIKNFTYTLQNNKVLNMTDNVYMFEMLENNKFVYNAIVDDVEYKFIFSHI